MSFDLARALRRIKPQRLAEPIRRRPVERLPMVTAPVSAGPALLLDTCVYIDVLQGRTPPAVDALLVARIVHHSTVCLSELTHLFGRLEPTHPGTKDALRELARTIADMPSHRISSPSEMVAGEAGMLAGMAARLLGVERQGRPSLLNDASLYLQALEHGWTVLTRNARDFDCFDQLLPANRLLLYDQQR